MLTSISPLGERARGNRWPVTVMWLTLGAIGGGTVLGVASGTIGGVITRGTVGGIEGGGDDTWRLVALAGAAMSAAVWDLSGRRFPGRRQVNEDWLPSFRSWIYGIGFGAQLGSAIATVIATALVPVFILAALLTASAVDGLVIGAVFGAMRGLSVTVNHGVQTVDDLQNLHRALDRSTDRIRRITAAAAASLGAAALLSLVF